MQFNHLRHQNDLISWLIAEAPESEQNVEDIALRILTINFAAIHTTSMVSLGPHLSVEANIPPELN